MSSYFNKKKTSKDIIINWYTKQNAVGKSKNERLGWFKKKGFRKRYKIMSEIIKNTERKNSILDFGCGFSHLYKYEFKKKKAKIDYIGIDAVKSHINYCKKKYPENEYFNCTLENFFPKKKYDYIFANGVFTVKRELTTKSMDIYVYKSLLRLFKICKIGIAVNFMSINVDWRRRDLFYLSIDKLIKFVTKKLTKKFIIRNDYNLYEYTIYIFKK